jgi:large subunit ribosomal protein L17
VRHRQTKATLDRNSAQRQRLVRNLVVSLLERERVVTTRARAGVMRSLAEHLLTLGKTGTLSHRRKILQLVPNERVARKVIEQLSPRYRERKGGYTRMTTLSRRAGDGAEQVVVELLP